MILLDTLGHQLTNWGWIATVIVVAVVGYYVKTGAGGQAITILRDANDVLARKVEDQQAVLDAKAAKIAELERTRTLEPIVAAISELAGNIEKLLHTNEERAQERHEGQLRALEAVTARLEQLSAQHEAPQPS